VPIVHPIVAVLNIKAEMKRWAEELAVKDVSKSATFLSQSTSVMSEFEETYVGVPVKMLTMPQIKRLIYTSRGSEFKDWENAIQCFPLGTCSKEDERSFLQFYLADLIFLLKSGMLNYFVDCTFFTVPRGFFQLMVIMVYLAAYDMYVLLQSKKCTAYYHAIHQCMYAGD
jgi:hypothetical protein